MITIASHTKPTVSAVVLVKNHRRFIRGCLETLRWVEEVVIVNDDSTDGTISIAKEFSNVRIHDRRLDSNWAAHRNYSFQVAESDWLLVCDVDHRITPDLAEEISATIARTSHNGFRIRQWNVVLGRIFGSEKRVKGEVILVRRGSAHWSSDNETHTQLTVDGTIGALDEPLIHLGPHIGSITEFFTKNAFYAETEAAANVKRNIRIPPQRGPGLVWWFILKPFLIFLWKYVNGYGKRGGAGFHYALLRAIGYYMVFLRTWEIRYVDQTDDNEMLAYCIKKGIPTFSD